MGDVDQKNNDRGDPDSLKPDKMFTLKKWNAVAMWSWDVECDTCAICRVQVMGMFILTFIINYQLLYIYSYLVKTAKENHFLVC